MEYWYFKNNSRLRPRSIQCTLSLMTTAFVLVPPWSHSMPLSLEELEFLCSNYEIRITAVVECGGHTALEGPNTLKNSD